MTTNHQPNADNQNLKEVARFPDMNPGPVLRLDNQGCVLLSNAAAQQLFGEDLHGKNWLDICKPVDEKAWKTILHTTEVVPVEASIGSQCFLFNHRCDPSAGLVFVFGSNITTLKSLERQLREMVRFPEMNPGPVVRTDVTGTVLLNNSAAQQVFGEDIRGKCWLDIWPTLKGETWDHILGSADIVPLEVSLNNCYFVFNHRRDVESGYVFVFGVDITTHKKTERLLAQNEKMATLGTLAAGIAHELNNPAAAAGSAAQQLIDLYERYDRIQLQLQQQALEPQDKALLQALTDKAHHRSERTHGMKRIQLMELESDMEDWLMDMGVKDGHLLAEPLVEMGFTMEELRGLAEQHQHELFFTLLESQVCQYQVNALLGELKEASGRISGIVKAMRSYSFLDQAAVKNVDVNEGIENTLIILANKLKQGITVTRDYGKLPLITAYGSELNQVWTNIIDNAIAAMNGRGAINIRSYLENDFVVVEMEDNGPGIPAHIQTRIFDPFFTTKDPGKGTGLGLSTSYGIITEKHHGSITVQSQPGMTKFTVKLPVG